MRTAAHRPPPSLPPIPAFQFRLLVTALLVAVVMLGFVPTRGAMNLPPTVLGTWETTSPQYAGRELVIGGRSVSFQAGSDFMDMSSHVILNVEQTQVTGGTLFKVEYVDGTVSDPPGIIQFIYRPEPAPSIVLAHQPDVVWRRVDSGEPAGH